MAVHRGWAAAAVLVILAGCTAAPPAAPTSAPTTTPVPTGRFGPNSLPGVLTQIAQGTIVPVTWTPAPSATSTPAVAQKPAGGQAKPAVAPPSAAPTATASNTPAGVDPSAVPQIELFTASPEVVNAGDKVTLTWKTNADRVSLRPFLGEGWPQPWFDQPGSGSMEFSTDPQARDGYRIQLVITVNGQSTDKSVAVHVACPDTWAFENPPGTCPYPAESGAGSIQLFEHGRMFWISATRTIVVLRSDATFAIGKDNWEAGMPESDPALTPPDGLLQPVRGFGKYWREQGEQVKLGWATSPEVPRLITFQCDSFVHNKTCLLAAPEGVVRLASFGGWSLYTGQ